MSRFTLFQADRPRDDAACASLRSGTTLTELLVALSVIGLLLALLVPAVQQVREASRRTQCRSNLKQIGIGMQSYHSVHGMFPPGSSNGFSLHVFLLPHVEQRNLYDQIDFSQDVVSVEGEWNGND
ncbi:MAG: DUF1559 domain-containing protein, partial [Planctomycetaceae bacterium]